MPSILIGAHWGPPRPRLAGIFRKSQLNDARREFSLKKKKVDKTEIFAFSRTGAFKYSDVNKDRIHKDKYKYKAFKDEDIYRFNDKDLTYNH